jgi:glycosyltransferase involved in cell wall biosynthesis
MIMNIGFIQTRFKHKSPGGGEFHTQNLADELIDMGHNVTVYCASTSNSRSTDDVSTETYDVPIDMNPVAETILARKAVPDVEEECDVCILTDGSAWYASKNLSIPTVMIFHFVWHGFNKRRGMKDTLLQAPHTLVYEKMEDAMVEETDAIVSISQNIREDIIHIDPSQTDKIHNIPNGVNTTFFTPSETKRTDFTVHFQGQLIEVKNPDLLIRAASMSDLDWDVVIGGSGPLRENLENLAKSLEVQDRVEFVGFVDYDELPELYATSDVYVLPSEYEGMPLTVLEAASCGTMPVVSERAATEFVTDDFGVILETLDPDNLSEVLDDLARNRKKVHKNGQNAREKAVELDWSEIALNYESLLSELVGKTISAGDDL